MTIFTLWPWNYACDLDPQFAEISVHERYILRSRKNMEKKYEASINTLRPRKNGCQFPDDIFKWIFVNEIIWISIKISLKFVPRGRIGSDNGLARTRRQAIIWTNDG